MLDCPKPASEALPMLNKVMGFPTHYHLNKQHDVVEISTGFNGPATGIYLYYISNRLKNVG
ncbi:MAG: hypothetical protein IPO47_19830 [Bacteroidetes bacterium]|nr:hypothetical protein [Bacteroidota bacterium]